MKVTQYGKNLWQVTRWAVFNCFLVAEEDGLTLVDTGMSGSARGFFDAAKEIGRPIRRITITHAHVDHIGSLDEVARMAPDAEVTYTERTGEFLRGKLALRAEEPQTKLRGGFATRETPATRFITPGDSVGSLQVVAAPGHSPDQVALFDERDGTLIAADAFQTAAGLAVAGDMRLLFPFPALATWHPPTALQSARSLRQLEPTRLAVGHGPTLESPLQKMDEAIQRAEASFVNG